jgi:hypothetical protein
MNRTAFASGKIAPRPPWRPLLPNDSHLDMGRVQEFIREGRSLVRHGYTDVRIPFNRNVLEGVPALVLRFTHPETNEGILLSMQHARWVRGPEEYSRYLFIDNGIEAFIKTYFLDA